MREAAWHRGLRFVQTIGKQTFRLDWTVVSKNNFSLYMKWSRLAKSLVFEWSRPMENRTKWLPFSLPLENWTTLKTEYTPTIRIPNLFGTPAPTNYNNHCYHSIGKWNRQEIDLAYVFLSKSIFFRRQFSKKVSCIPACLSHNFFFWKH